MKVIDARLLEEIVQRIVAALQPEVIYLYGSHAYGQPHEDSDIDLLVVVGGIGCASRQSVVEAYRALRGLCVPVEVHVVTQNEFARRVQWLSSVERAAKERGKILYVSPAGVSGVYDGRY
jgi:predicted nucleotidyltransferase